MALNKCIIFNLLLKNNIFIKVLKNKLIDHKMRNNKNALKKIILIYKAIYLPSV